MSDNVSRRDFLKLLGVGAVTLGIGGFGGISQLVTNQKINKPAFAQQGTGSWANGQNCTVNPIHVALLPSGRIFYLAGSGYSTAQQFGPYTARVLDINTGSESSLTQTDDLFCIGLTHLADGTVLMSGGTLLYNGNPDNCNGRWHGLNAAYELSPSSEILTKVTNMRHGRWYPTLVTLPDGKVWCCSGYDEYGVINRIVEVYDPNSKTWALVEDPNSNYTYVVGAGYETTCPGPHPTYSRTCPPVSFYPRTHLMPNGLLVLCGMRRENWTWNPANGDFVSIGNSSVYRDYGTSFLCPLQNTTSEKGKILLVGGSETAGGVATTSCEMLDFNASSTSIPVRRSVSPLTYRRKFFAPIMLPNGKMLVLGGSEQTNNPPVYIPEIFDPVSETWQSDLPPASIPRVYHSVGLLLPDGRVWNAGGNPNNGVWRPETQIFSPGYLFAGTRPTISGDPVVGSYGSSIIIPTPDAATIASVSLVRLMALTHHHDANQRLVWLQITGTSSDNITVSAPINANIAPPGHYMIHVLNSSGVPSIAKIIAIPGTAEPSDTIAPSQVTGLAATAVSSTQINLAWTANPPADGVANYNVYRDTTAGFPVTPGTTPPIATPATNSYSDSGLTASTTYYYKVAAVDAAGNIGPLSSEASITPPSQVTGLAATAVSSTQINLAWTANPPADGVANYNVYRGATAGFPVTPGTTPIATPATNSYSDSGLTASTTYYYKVAAVNAAGNIGPLSSEVFATTFITDTVRPTIAVTSPTPNSSVSSGTVIIQGTSSDNAGGSGIRDVFTRLDASGYVIATPQSPGNWSTWSRNYNITATGSHTIIARATDNAGNVQWTATIPFTVTGPDTTRPTIAVTSPTPNSSVPRGTVVIQGTSSDNAGGSGIRDVFTRLDASGYVIATPQSPGNWSTWSRNYNITATGSHTIIARATDNAGNVQWTAVIPFTVT